MKFACVLSLVIAASSLGVTQEIEEVQSSTETGGQVEDNLEEEMTRNEEPSQESQSTTPLLKLALLDELVKQEVNCTQPCTRFMTQDQEQKLRSILVENMGHPIRDPSVSNEVLLMCALTKQFEKNNENQEVSGNLALLRKVIDKGIKKKLSNGDLNQQLKDVLIEALARDIKTDKPAQGTVPAATLGDLGINLLGELKVIIQNQTVIVNNSAPVGNIYLDQNAVMQNINASGGGPGGTNIATDQNMRADGANGGVPLCGPYEHLYRDDCAPSCAPWDLDCQMSLSKQKFQNKLSKRVIKQINDVYDTFTGSFFEKDDDDDDDDSEEDDNEEDTTRFRSLLTAMEEDSSENTKMNSLRGRSGISDSVETAISDNESVEDSLVQRSEQNLVESNAAPDTTSVMIDQENAAISSDNLQNFADNPEAVNNNEQIDSDQNNALVSADVPSQNQQSSVDTILGTAPEVENITQVINSDGKSKMTVSVQPKNDYNSICESL